MRIGDLALSINKQVFGFDFTNVEKTLDPTQSCFDIKYNLLKVTPHVFTYKHKQRIISCKVFACDTSITGVPVINGLMKCVDIVEMVNRCVRCMIAKHTNIAFLLGKNSIIIFIDV